MADHAVVIVGGGPSGLMLAAELTLADVDVLVVEQHTSRDFGGARAGGLHARTIEVLDQRGVVDRFLAEGQIAQVAGFSWIPLDISDFPTRHPYGLALWQTHFERILGGWVDELGVRVRRGLAATGFVQDDRGVDLQLSDGTSVHAQYLVGCDGGRSLIRKAAGIDFAGWDASTSALIAEAEFADEPESGTRRDERGVHALARMGDGGPVRVVVTEREVGRTGEPTVQDLSEALIEVYGTDYGVHDVTWLSRFTDTTRQAVSYREQRVLLAGDAAHAHSPMGGQGLNIGVQDAVNLGWKLAQVVMGTSPEDLLDTYHAERHPVGARALRTTMAAVALSRYDERMNALRDTVTDLLQLDEPRKQLAGMLSGLDVHYDLGEGHPLLGRRMPDLDVVTADGTVRVFTLLRDARPVCINFGARGSIDVGPWADRVQLVEADAAGEWELPVLGAVASPAAVVVRPDGHVAWVGEHTGDAGLVAALTRWFGPPAP